MKEDDNNLELNLRTDNSRERQDSLMRSSADTYCSQRSSKRKGSEWEILGNLEKGVAYTIKPKIKNEPFDRKGNW